MKHGALFVGLIAISLSLVDLCFGQATKPTDDAPRFNAQEFTSPLALEIWAQTGRADAALVGETPSQSPIKIPDCRDWWVTPKATTSMDDLAAAIGDGKISRLKLSSAVDQDIARLRGLTGLQALNLSGTQVTGSAMESISTLTALDELNLQGTKVGSAALLPVKALKHLKSLNLSHSQILGLYNLEILAGLEELNLSGTPVADTSLQHFKHMANMHTLDLSHTKVTDAGLERLKILKKLKQLNLTGTAVTQAGVADLKLSLPGCTVTMNGDTPTTQM